VPSTGRRCAEFTRSGDPCRMPPLVDGELCFTHAPETAVERAEARAVGGRRRRSEGIISVSYDLDGLTGAQGIIRLLEIVVLDTLQLPNTNQRSRTLIQAVKAAADLHRVGELEERLARLEAVTRRKR
jgi:hypothetical protein